MPLLLRQARSVLAKADKRCRLAIGLPALLALAFVEKSRLGGTAYFFRVFEPVRVGGEQLISCGGRPANAS